MILYIQNDLYRGLGKSIAKKKGWRVGRIEQKQFSDNEWYLQIKGRVKDEQTWVLGSTHPPADNLVQTILLVNALKANGARQVNLILPYFAYQRQDRVDAPGAPISAQAISQLLQSTGVKKIACVDLHSQAVEKFLGQSLIHIDSIPLLASQFIKAGRNTVIASPDQGAIERARRFAGILKRQVVLLKKRRPTRETAEIIGLKGKVKNKDVIIVDDMIQTGGTLIAAAQVLKKQGANKIFVAATHGLFVSDALKKLQKSPIEKVIITNTYALDRKRKFKKLKIVDIADTIAKTLR